MMATKRKATLRCAAANDDEDFADLFQEAEERKSRRENRSQSSAQKATEAPVEVKPERKKKALAWMDSDDEDPDGDDSAAATVEKKETRERIDEGALDGVQSFGRMMMLLPELQRRLRGNDLSASEIAAACRGIGRTKFFDGDLLDDLYRTLRQMLRSGKMDLRQVDDVISCLWTINAYDRGVFSALASFCRSAVRGLERGKREQWLTIFRAFRHEEEKDFLQLLEVPPLDVTSVGYKKLRCFHFAAGGCILASACTFAHDMKAPLSLDQLSGVGMGFQQVVMTASQENIGRGLYGKPGTRHTPNIQ